MIKVINCVRGVISPTLSNMTLDGLERAVHDAVPSRRRVNFVRYADGTPVQARNKWGVSPLTPLVHSRV